MLRTRCTVDLAALCFLWLLFSASVHAQQLASPVRLALMPSGHLLVTEQAGDTVVEWDPHRGRAVRVTPIAGRPVGIAWGWGRLFIGNEISGSVEVYNPAGKLQYVLGGEPGQVSRPSDIAVDKGRGLVFVVDGTGARVLVYDFRGPLLHTLPAPDAPPLYQPTALAVDPVRGEVLVSDFGKAGWFSMRAWVRIYDYDGQYRGGIPGNGDPGYRFSRPQGLAVNQQGLIYLVDSLRSQVLIFDRGALAGVAILGEVGTELGQLLLPLDAVIDEKADNLYVTNNRHGRLETFVGKGVSP